MRRLAFLLLLLGPVLCNGQSFNRPLTEAVRMPRPAILQLIAHLEKHENYPVMPERFTQLPTFNVLHPSQRELTDGIYYFISSAHDTGNLFINRKGKITVLLNSSTAEILTAYSTYLKRNPLPEATEIAYLSAISAFLKHQYKSRKEMIKSGALQELKQGAR
ncbi:hypothetical protein IC235_21185 [Hymenobacter sp. BT664]|uniref:Spi protease inhibitor domain-containing protein n=1 Tax=Hymenobacter montanus TaxID=2771359 RepID=A0A927GL89_9BACT|nr:hypothetical protein [Hymenobacter montanus]MBD2770408.1 hypothetical protein [Hymenobacter montanus]